MDKIKQLKDIPDKAVCLAYSLGPSDVFPYQTLSIMFHVNEKLAYKACERACNKGLIEYGVSLRTGWLTDKGKELIREDLEGDLK